jgi:hypothetical protein
MSVLDAFGADYKLWKSSICIFLKTVPFSCSEFVCYDLVEIFPSEECVKVSNGKLDGQKCVSSDGRKTKSAVRQQTVFIENMGVAVESECIALCQHCKRLLRNGVVCEYKRFITCFGTSNCLIRTCGGLRAAANLLR